MSNTYVLVNPNIDGSISTSIKADNSVSAAKKAYKSLSKHFNNNIPKFHFTIQKGTKGSGKYYHFEVKERKEDDNVTFSIEKFNIKNEKTQIKKFEKKLNNFKNKINSSGGKRSKKGKKDSDDSESSDYSDSDDAYYRRVRKYIPTNYNYPIYYWWYDPYVYNLDSFFVPTFYTPLTPYI